MPHFLFSGVKFYPHDGNHAHVLMMKKIEVKKNMYEGKYTY